ncbi:MAG: hypothetical protein ACYS0H_22970 [Planctomycetota bacterium]|jgi:hypothetical protein
MLTSKNEHKVIFGLLWTPLFVFAAFFDICDYWWLHPMHVETMSGFARKNALLV